MPNQDKHPAAIRFIRMIRVQNNALDLALSLKLDDPEIDRRGNNLWKIG